MRLVFLLFAESAELIERGRLNIEGSDFNTVLVADYPVILQGLTVVCKVEGRTDELGEHSVTVLVIGPDGELVATPVGRSFVLVGSPLVPYRPVQHSEIFAIDAIAVARPGDYAVHVLVDNVNLGSELLFLR